MKRSALFHISFGILCLLLASTVNAQKNAPAKPKPASGSTAAPKSGAGDQAPAADDEAATEKELNTILELPAPERVAKLKTFIAGHPRSTHKLRATESLVKARAAWGESKLLASDPAGALALFLQAVADAPANMSDKLYDQIVSQLPAALFVRDQRAAALELGRAIEAKVSDNPQRLLNLALFYMGAEEGAAAARVASQAAKVDPTKLEAFMALGSAQRIMLQLDEAAQSFAKAAALSSTYPNARRSLADMKRATGHPDEALVLYRELFTSDSNDEFARTGMVLSLFDTNQKEEAERELTAALEVNPRSLSLLAGAAYWYAAHNDGKHAVEYASKAVQLEPRYVWGQIALARGLLALKQPLAAERSLRFARNFGNFPTLTYELASTLVAAGFYDEATRELAGAFTIKDGKIETLLAGKIAAQADSFTALLAPERRASIFQSSTADSEANAQSLKDLLQLDTILNEPKVREDAAASSARAFAGGTDEMRAYRQLYAASRLARVGAAWPDALVLTDSATSGIENALDVPNASAAVMADELGPARQKALADGGTLNIPNVDRPTLSRIVRGRLEDLAGWSLLNQKKPAEAVVRLRRSVSVLPENSNWWRGAMWHLGSALDAAGQGPEALNIYYQIYNTGEQEFGRRLMIESLYRRINGSLNGIEDVIGPAQPSGPAPTTRSTPAVAPTPEPTPVAAIPETTGTPEPAPVAEAKPADTTATPAISMTLPRDAATAPKPSESPTPEPTATPAAPPVPEPKVTPIVELPPVTTESKPETKPEITAPAATPPNPEPTPEPSAVTPTTSQKVELRMPTDTPVEPTSNDGAGSSKARERIVDPSVAAAAGEASLTNAYASLYAAVHDHDTDSLRRLLSSSTVTYLSNLSMTEQKPVSELLRSGLTETTTAPEMPEVRNLRMSGTTATLEVHNLAKDRWDRIPFVKEDGQWKLALGEMNDGKFRDPETNSLVSWMVIEKSATTAIPTAETPTPAVTKPADGACSMVISEPDISLLSNGGSVSVTITLEGSAEIDKISASTSNWSDIAVFPQSGLRADATGRVFVITSISKKTGEFTVSFKSPCGTREVKVTVR
ncbi:MAG: hypothetical protein ABIP75_13055 [Pyrinomonadaceae bacterium]